MKKKVPRVVIVALLLTTLIMRAPITCVGPVAFEWQQVLSIDHRIYGLLSAVPVFCLGVFCLVVPWLTKRLSINNALLLILRNLCTKD